MRTIVLDPADWSIHQPSYLQHEAEDRYFDFKVLGYDVDREGRITSNVWYVFKDNLNIDHNSNTEYYNIYIM